MPRELAWQFTDREGHFLSESSVYRILKAYDSNSRQQSPWFLSRSPNALAPGIEPSVDRRARAGVERGDEAGRWPMRPTARHRLFRNSCSRVLDGPPINETKYTPAAAWAERSA